MEIEQRYKLLCSIHNGNKFASSLINDVKRYVIIRQLLHSIFNILPVLTRWWEIYLHKNFLS
jgi:hypothetical protein